MVIRGIHVPHPAGGYSPSNPAILLDCDSGCPSPQGFAPTIQSSKSAILLICDTNMTTVTHLCHGSISLLLTHN